MISSEDKNDLIEYSNTPTELEPSVKCALDNILDTEQMISREINIPAGPELNAMVGEALVYIAEETIEESSDVNELSQGDKINNAVGAVIAEGALEECGSKPSTEENPIRVLVDDGYDDEVETAVGIFDQHEAKLPGKRRSIAELAVSVIDRLKSIPNNIAINKAVRLINIGDDLNFDLLGYAKKYIEKNNVDIENPKIQHALLKNVERYMPYGQISNTIEEHLELGLKPEIVLRDEVIKEIITKKLSNFYENFDANTYEIGDTLLSLVKQCTSEHPELIKSDEFRADVQKLGNECFDDTIGLVDRYDCSEHDKRILKEEKKFLIDFLQPLGYEIDKSKFLNTEGDTIRSPEQQDRLNEAGLWTPDMTDYIYNMRLELVKKAQNENNTGAYNDKGLGLGAHIEISPNLEATETTAIYWQSQSKLIGTDAQMLVFNNIQLTECNAFGISIEDYTRKFVKRYGCEPSDVDIEDSQKRQLFSPDGLPFTDLFTSQYEGLSHVINFYNYHNVTDKKHDNSSENNINKVMGFLSNNLDKLTEYDREYVKLWVSMPDELKTPLIQYASANENMIDGMFDENGPTENFYKSAISCETSMRIVSNIDNWQEHYSECEISYGNFVKTYTNITINISVDEIPDYFDENGPTSKLHQKIFHHQDIEGIKALCSMEDTKSSLNACQYTYLEFMKDNNYPKELLVIRESLDEFFDENGPNDNFWQKQFSTGNFDIICSQTADIILTMHLSDKQTIAIDSLIKITDVALKSELKSFILSEGIEDIDAKKLILAPELLNNMVSSNALEIYTHRLPLTKQLLYAQDPLVSFNRIEQIFIRNNLPFVGKIYSVFDIMHPKNRLDSEIDDSSVVSPILKQNRHRDIIIFNDLLKCEFGSNNKSLREYLNLLNDSEELINRLDNDKSSWESLTAEETKKIERFIATLDITLSKTKYGSDLSQNIDNIKARYESLRQSFNPSDGQKLADRIIRMFAAPLGISSFSEAIQYMDNSCQQADERNRQAAESEIKIHQGDFVKGIGGITYLSKIMQNGSVAKEFLGDSAGSDMTPFDTDLSIILDEPESINSAIDKAISGSYGPIWFILKNDDRFDITRRSPNETNQTIVSSWNKNKLEAFHSNAIGGKDHYGIRTGFATSEIDCIAVDAESDWRVGLEIAKNGFYIPVINKNTGKIIFSPKDYDNIRSKMSGLSHYNTGEYIFSKDQLKSNKKYSATQIAVSIKETEQKRIAIIETVSEVANSLNMQLKNTDGTLSYGLELIDTGSTGRDTNSLGDGDFDFMMRVDKSDFIDEEKMNKLRKLLSLKFGKSDIDVISSGDIRLKGCNIDGIVKPVDIDITFVIKTNKLEYTTEQALKDRLDSIRNQDPNKYYDVISNILFAKSILKEAGAYKPNRGDNTQGGLGGVGIENWILQNGGSFMSAAKDFIKTADSVKSFSEFKNKYLVLDFGENHMSIRNNNYAHDNFVDHNMSEAGYEIMKKVLKRFA